MGARFQILRQDDKTITIEDLGPFEDHKTVTNDAEDVVKRLFEYFGLGDRQLYYIDSDGQLDEIVHDGPKFRYFATEARAW